MQPILNIALRASRQACEYINQSIDKNEPSLSDAHSDEKLLNHLESSLFQAFFDSLKKANPTHYIIPPGETPNEVKEDSWQVNSIHAPQHLLRKLPYTAISLVHKRQDRLQNALLVNPTNGDEYTASRGSGAALNGRRIRCTSTKSLSDATIATNTLNQFSSHAEAHIVTDFISELGTSVNQILVGNCDVLDIAMVASGQIDAAVLTKVDPQEIEASLLLCQEAGVLSGTLSGGLFGSKEDKLIVANPKLFKALVQRLNGYQNKL
jgi:myo-inositol-1(or 4)-monophosphatase